MKIVLKESFVNRFENQIEYIADDNLKAAKQLKKQLLERIKSISSNPLRFRKSIYFDDGKIRDLIYKGYTIVFRINGERIEIFGFVKSQNRPTD